MGKGLRHQAGGSAKHHIRPAGAKRPEIGTRDPGVEDITDDHNAPPAQGLGQRIFGVEVMSERVEVQQTLTGVAVQTVTGIEHHRAFTGAFQCFRQLTGNTGAAMTHHEHIRTHGHIRASGIQQRLAFAQ